MTEHLSPAALPTTRGRSHILTRAFPGCLMLSGASRWHNW